MHTSTHHSVHVSTLMTITWTELRVHLSYRIFVISWITSPSAAVHIWQDHQMWIFFSNAKSKYPKKCENSAQRLKQLQLSTKWCPGYNAVTVRSTCCRWEDITMLWCLQTQEFSDTAEPTVQTSAVMSRHPPQCACVYSQSPVNIKIQHKRLIIYFLSEGGTEDSP